MLSSIYTFYVEHKCLISEHSEDEEQVTYSRRLQEKVPRSGKNGQASHARLNPEREFPAGRGTRLLSISTCMQAHTCKISETSTFIYDTLLIFKLEILFLVFYFPSCCIPFLQLLLTPVLNDICFAVCLFLCVVQSLKLQDFF